MEIFNHTKTLTYVSAPLSSIKHILDLGRHLRSLIELFLRDLTRVQHLLDLLLRVALKVLSELVERPEHVHDVAKWSRHLRHASAEHVE